MQPTAPRRQSNASGFDERSFNPPRHWRPLALVQDDHGDPDATMPLFLSDPDGEPDPDEFVPAPARKGLVFRLAMGGLAVAAAATIAATFHSNIQSLFAGNLIGNAKASLEASMAYGSTPTVQDPPASPPSNPVQDSVRLGEPARPAAAVPAPSREAMAAAYHSALQNPAQAVQMAGQPPSVAPAPASEVAADVVHRLSPDEITSLLKRGDGLIASGDIAAARLVLVRAAEAGDGRAAAKLAGTYDPAVLAKLGVRGVVADVAMARAWYAKAAQAGAIDARQRLEALATRQQ